jgi:condensin complex subunit 1
LPFKSERSVKKLIEGLQFYRDKLHEETVFTRFTEILAKVRQAVHFFSRSSLKKRSKARSNKSANKPDTELNEFEAVSCLSDFVAFQKA